MNYNIDWYMYMLSLKLCKRTTAITTKQPEIIRQYMSTKLSKTRHLVINECQPSYDIIMRVSEKLHANNDNNKTKKC